MSESPAREWLQALQDTQERQQQVSGEVRLHTRAPSFPADRRLVYQLHLTEQAAEAGVRVEIATQRRDRDGSWDEPKPFAFSADEGADVGLDAETNVSPDYKQNANAFTGKIVKVTVVQK